MKTIKILIIFSISFFQVLNAQTITELMSRDKIVHNKIESITQYTHRFVNNKVSPKGYKSVQTFYDKKGNIIKVENFKPNGTVASRHLYKYDKNNQKIEYMQYQFLPNGKFGLSLRQVFSYDSNGNKKNEIGYDGRTTYRIEYKYTPENKPLEIIKYSSNNKVSDNWKYEYNGKSVTIYIYEKENSLKRKIVRVLDNNDRVIDEKNFTSAGKELGRTVTTYNGENVASKLEYYAGELRARYDYVYDKSGQLVEVYLTEPGKKNLLYRSYKYDDNGNLLEEKWYEDGAADYSRKGYKIDNKGNINEVDAFYSDYNYRVVYRYTYTFR